MKHLLKWTLPCGMALAWSLAAVPCLLSAPSPEWIWHSQTNAPQSGTQTVYFRKAFRTPPLLWNAKIAVSADDAAELFLNGIAVAATESWDRPLRGEVSMRLNQGENVLAVRARNRIGPAGLLVQLGLGGETNIVTDSSWLVTTREEPGWTTLGFNAAHWEPARVLGAQGIAPWGDVLLRGTATAAESLTVLPGFKVELLRSAAPDEGSWICMAFDQRGRLTIASEGDQRPLLRLTLASAKVTALERIEAPVRYAMGLLYTGDRLYANARGPAGAGLYALTDTNGNDQFEPEEMRLLKRFEGGSEHGYHALRLGPDGRIYVINGNGTKLPEGILKSSAHQHYAQDVLSLNPDETTEVGPEAAVQCHVLRTDREGQNWELWAGGMRNAYAFDFSPEGEMFIFDSDMEWDWGTPWYRPTRLLHGVSGGDYGWRDGTRTWPESYEDSLPPVFDVGIGSPTGVRFGARSRFPQEFQRALFIMDWSYGRILAVHLTPKGASYAATCQTFLKGAPLNLTDLDFGPDGAMFFITGGRGTQSGLYRVSYEGPDAVSQLKPTSQTSGSVNGAHELRHQLERFHGHPDLSAVAFLWPHLGSADRFVRYAARVALESQALSSWSDRALSETNVAAASSALLALARVGPSELQRPVIKAVLGFPLTGLPHDQQLGLWRVIEVSLLRQGSLDDALRQELATRLDPLYPAGTWAQNRELSRLLIFLHAHNVVPKTLDLLSAAPTQEQQFHYVAQLRSLRDGWMLPDRRRYLEWWLKPRQQLLKPSELISWFADVGRRYVDGAWVDRYLREFRADAIAGLSSSERKELADLLAKPVQRALLTPTQPRAFVREWTMADLLPDLDRLGKGRNLERGRQTFADVQCITCHRFGNDGGAVGPELTGAGSKYDARSLLESLLEPSKVVAEQFQDQTVRLKDGDSFTGRILRETAERIVLETDHLNGIRETIERTSVEGIAASTVSPMPDGLANTLTREEILDLIAYLQSGGPQAGVERPAGLAE